MNNLAIIQNGESPATAVGLAVGSVDEFERRLFTERRPMRFSDGDEAVEKWIAEMRTLAGNLQDRHARMLSRYRSLQSIEPDCAGPISNAISDNLRPIGAKIAPNLSGEQALAWRKAIVMALSDMPPDIVVLAVRKTLHTPMQFLSEVETKVRENAALPMVRLRNAAHSYEELTRQALPNIAGEIKDAMPI